MQNSSFHSAGKTLRAIAAGLALLLLAACDLTVTNLTPSTVPQNPSHIYTITATFMPKRSNVLPDSIQPRIIIDGQSFNMTKSAAAAYVWEFDYQLPPGRPNASYYFICEYAVKSGEGSAPRDTYTELQSLSINARYVLRAEASRAPIGARVNIVGAGFTPQDVIYLNGQPTRTVFESPAALSFFVPSVTVGASYQLNINGPTGSLAAGTFRVDPAGIEVFPSALTMKSGEMQSLTFSISTPAPVGGLLIEVTTDIPESVIMPEVLIPTGLTSATINVTGGKPGAGSLYYKTSSGESAVAVTVEPK